MGAFLIGGRMRNIDLIRNYNKIQDIVAIFNSIKVSRRAVFGEEIMKKQTINVELGKLFVKHKILDDYPVFKILVKLLVACYNNPEETNISELKIINDLTDDEIKDIYDSLEEQIKENPGIFA